MTSVTIVVDNFCQRQGLYAEWGFSAFIRTPSGNLLWDTGGILHVLLHNLRALGIRPEGVENLALSHGYYDLKEVRQVTFGEDSREGHLVTGMLDESLMDGDEQLFQSLWKTYFKAICIKERLNPRKHKQDMPVRYWKYLTEKQQ